MNNLNFVLKAWNNKVVLFSFTVRKSSQMKLDGWIEITVIFTLKFSIMGQSLPLLNTVHQLSVKMILIIIIFIACHSRKVCWTLSWSSFTFEAHKYKTDAFHMLLCSVKLTACFSLAVLLWVSLFSVVLRFIARLTGKETKCIFLN